MTLRLIFLDAGTGQAILIGQSIEQDVMNQRLPRQASFNGSGDIRTYLVVLAIEACPISLLSRQASMPPLACMVPVVCRKQCGCTGQLILAFCPAVAIILLIADRVKAWPRSLVKMCARFGFCSRCSRFRPLASSRSR